MQRNSKSQTGLFPVNIRKNVVNMGKSTDYLKSLKNIEFDIIDVVKSQSNITLWNILQGTVLVPHLFHIKCIVNVS